MNNEKRNIRHLYRPNYINEKKEQKKIDEYIKLECNNACGGSLVIHSSDLTKWRANPQRKRSFGEIQRLYEIKQIFKRYKIEMNEEKKGLPNRYIDDLTNLLSMENQKDYLKMRLEMIQKANNNTILNNTISNGSSKESQFNLYITTNNKYGNRPKIKSMLPFHFTTLNNNYNIHHQKHINTKYHETEPAKTDRINRYADYDYNEEEANILIDPDQEVDGNPDEIKSKHTNLLYKLNPFYNPIKNHGEYISLNRKRHLNIINNIHHKKNDSSPSRSNSRNYFFKFLERRKENRKKETYERSYK